MLQNEEKAGDRIIVWELKIRLIQPLLYTDTDEQSKSNISDIIIE